MTTTASPSRTRRSETRRDDLLHAAQSLFTERGVAATAVSDITDRAGVAKGTFYLYFDSKDHVVAGLHERAIAGMAVMVERALSALDADDILTMSDELTARVIEYWIDQRDLFRAIREAGETPEIARMKSEYDQRIIDMFKAGIQFGIDQGRVAVADPERAAQFIYYGCQGATISALLSPGRIQRKALIESAQTTIRKILRP